MNANLFARLVSTTALMGCCANVLIKHGITHGGDFTFSMSCIVREMFQLAVTVGFVMAVTAALLWLQILSTEKLATCKSIFVSLTYVLVAVAVILISSRNLDNPRPGWLTMIVGLVFVARADS